MLLAAAAASRQARRLGRAFRGVVVVVEGNGESGAGLAEPLESVGGRAWLAELAGPLGFAAVVNANGLWLDQARPCVCVGTRGHLVVTVQVSSAEPDTGSATSGGLSTSRSVHNGVDGDVLMRQPAAELCGILHALTVRPAMAAPKQQDDHAGAAPKLQVDDASAGLAAASAGLGPVLGEVALPAWMRRLVRRPTARQDALAVRVAQGLVGDAASLSPGRAATAAHFARRWFLPALTVHDVQTSTGSAASLVPGRATATVSVRLPAGITASEAVEALAAEVKSIHRSLTSTAAAAAATASSGGAASVRLVRWSEAWLARSESWIADAAEQAVRDAWSDTPAGDRVLRVCDGGTMRTVPALERAGRAPAVVVCFAPADARPHLVDENITLDALVRGADVIRRLCLL
jgi:acetylornithine deacetylase/succinyl-diaminopimelate desuccinylase-like protein